MPKVFADVDLETHAKVRLLECIVMPSKENVDVRLLESSKPEAGVVE